MSISNNELIALFGATGYGRIPITGGPASSLKPSIAQTCPLEHSAPSIQPATGTLQLTAIYLTANQTISNINFLSGTTAEATGTHLWFALYDDGRGSSTANQLALLGQTPDQTGAAAFAANTNLGLALITPYTTQYSGIYYVGVMCAAGTTPQLFGNTRTSTASIQLASTTSSTFTHSMTAGSSLTANAPHPSGVLSFSAQVYYAYLS